MRVVLGCHVQVALEIVPCILLAKTTRIIAQLKTKFQRQFDAQLRRDLAPAAEL